MIRKDSAKKTMKKSHVKAFVKLIDYQHLLPTRYTLDDDLKAIVSTDVLQEKDKKITTLKETNKCLEERFKTGWEHVLLHQAQVLSMLLLGLFSTVFGLSCFL